MKWGMMRLSKEDLHLEREWHAEGITVLRAEVTLPQCEGKSRRARRFNRYYRSFAEAFFRYCAAELYPAAAERMYRAAERSAPWQTGQAELRYHATLLREDILSLYTDALENVGTAPVCLRRADTWSLADGLPLPAECFFSRETAVKKLLLAHGRRRVLERMEGGEPFCRHWRFRLRRFLSLRNFYLTQEGVVWFYPAGTLKEGGGIVTFSIPYGEAGAELPPLP